MTYAIGNIKEIMVVVVREDDHQYVLRGDIRKGSVVEVETEQDDILRFFSALPNMALNPRKITSMSVKWDVSPDEKTGRVYTIEDTSISGENRRVALPDAIEDEVFCVHCDGRLIKHGRHVWIHQETYTAACKPQVATPKKRGSNA